MLMAGRGILLFLNMMESQAEASFVQPLRNYIARKFNVSLEIGQRICYNYWILLMSMI